MLQKRSMAPQPEGDAMGMRESTQGQFNGSSVEKRKPGQPPPITMPPPPSQLQLFQPLPSASPLQMVSPGGTPQEQQPDLQMLLRKILGNG